MARRPDNRRELAAAAPPMPPAMPPPHHKTNVVDAMFPVARKLYDSDEEVRELASSINPANSPSGRVCFDDGEIARRMKIAIGENGGNPLLDNLSLGAISTAFKRCLGRVGLSRSQRITAARNNLLTTQPAE